MINKTIAIYAFIDNLQKIPVRDEQLTMSN